MQERRHTIAVQLAPHSLASEFMRDTRVCGHEHQVDVPLVEHVAPTGVQPGDVQIIPEDPIAQERSRTSGRSSSKALITKTTRTIAHTV